ncbi:MAG: OmpA family protein [Dongiaceae bacterium]
MSAAVLAVGLLIAGCSSERDVPPTVASAAGGGTQINTDTGTGGNFPDVNTVPNQRPTSTIQDLNLAPEGLSGAQSGTHYGEALVGGPTSTAAPPPPPPPPAPQEQLAPIPETGIKTESTGDTGAPPAEPVSSPPVAASAPPPAEPTASSEPVATPAATEEPTASDEPIPTPEVAAPAPMEPAESGEVAQAPAPEPATQGETVQGTTAAPAEDSGVEAPSAPTVTEAQQPAPPVAPTTPEPQPSEEIAAVAPAGAQAPETSVPQQQAPATAYQPNYAAIAPEAYGISSPQPTTSANQVYNSAQETYQLYGDANGAYPTAPAEPAATAPAGYGRPNYGSEPVGLIFFDEGSSNLSSDDRRVLEQIAQVQHTYGGVIHVVGHASMGVASADYARQQEANQRISEARAQSVARQLVENGVPQEAIQVTAVGDSQPLYSEASPSGEAGNRRVEVYIGAY